MFAQPQPQPQRSRVLYNGEMKNTVPLWFPLSCFTCGLINNSTQVTRQTRTVCRMESWWTSVKQRCITTTLQLGRTRTSLDKSTCIKSWRAIIKRKIIRLAERCRRFEGICCPHSHNRMFQRHYLHTSPIHKSSENLRVNSKFLTPERWQESSSAQICTVQHDTHQAKTNVTIFFPSKLRTWALELSEVSLKLRQP